MKRMKGSPKHLKRRSLKKKVSDSGKEEESKKVIGLEKTKGEKERDSYLDEVKDALEKKGADVNEKNGKFGWTALHRFCAEDNLEGVKFLLTQKGIDVNVLDNKNKTPLILMAQSRPDETDTRAEITDLLLKNGAKMEIRDENVINVFHYACLNKHVKIIEVLLRHNPDIINSTGAIDSKGNILEKTALHLLTSSKNDYIEIIDLLLKNGANVNAFDLKGRTPLHLACGYNNIEIVRLLLEKKSKEIDVNALDYDLQTPLHLACMGEGEESEILEIVDLLLKNGAYVNIQNSVNFQTPLHYSFMGGKLKISELLLENGAYLDFLTSSDTYKYLKKDIQPQFISLISYYSMNPANLLLKDGKLRNTTTALHLICKQGYLNNFTRLVQKERSIVNDALYLQDEKGNTPLHLACEYNHYDIVHAILKNVIGFNIYILNDDGNTPLHIACEKGNEKIFNELFQYIKEDPSLRRFFIIKNKKGDNLKSIAERSGNENIINIVNIETDKLKTDLLTYIVDNDLNGFKNKLSEFSITNFPLLEFDYINNSDIPSRVEFLKALLPIMPKININKVVGDEMRIPIDVELEKRRKEILLKAEEDRRFKEFLTKQNNEDLVKNVTSNFNTLDNITGSLMNKEAKVKKKFEEIMNETEEVRKRYEDMVNIVRSSLTHEDSLHAITTNKNEKEEFYNTVYEIMGLKDISDENLRKEATLEAKKMIDHAFRKLLKERREKEDEERRKKAEEELLKEEEDEKRRKEKSRKVIKTSLKPSSSPSPSPPPQPQPLSPISLLSSDFSSVSLTKTSDDKRDIEREKRVLDDLNNYKEKEYETYSKNKEEVRLKESECNELINAFDLKRGELSSHALESTIENYNSNNVLLNLNKDITTLKKTYGDKKKELGRLIPAGENLLNKLKLNKTYYVYNPKQCQYLNKKQTCGSLNLNIKIKPDKDNEIKIHGLFPDEAETDERNTFDETSLRKNLFDQFYREYRIGKDTPELHKHFSNYNHLVYKTIYENNFFNFFTSKEDFIGSFMWHFKFSNQNLLLFLNNILWLSDAIIIALSTDRKVFNDKDPVSLNAKVNNLLSSQLGKDFFYSDIGEDDIVVNGKVVGKESQIKLYFHLCYNDEIEHPKWQFCKKDYKFQNINADTKALFKSSIKSRETKSKDGKKSIRRKSVKRKSVKRKSVKRKSVKRKSVKRKSVKRKSVRRKSARKSARRKSVRRK